MLKLNASVHSWLTKQERRLQNALVEQQLKEAAAKVGIELLEEKDELESEHSNKLTIATAKTSSNHTTQEQTVEPDSTTISNKTTMITVTDSNGNQVETHTAASTTTATAIINSTSTTTTTLTTTSNVGTCTSVQTTTTVGEKNWDLQSLITSENEFHKHLKDEVSDMYTAWDEADLR